MNKTIRVRTIQPYPFLLKIATFTVACLMLIFSSCSNKTKKITPGEILAKEYQYDNLPDSMKARIKFASSEWNLGQVGKYVPKKVRFEFQNIGKSPLILHEVHAYCSCLKVDFSKEPVPSGHKGYITVMYDSQDGEQGIFNKEIVVNSNAVNKYVSLQVKGYKN